MSVAAKAGKGATMTTESQRTQTDQREVVRGGAWVGGDGQPVTLRCAHIIGRVGALAVALGIGIAVTNGSAIARADGSEVSTPSTSDAPPESPSSSALGRPHRAALPRLDGIARTLAASTARGGASSIPSTRTSTTDTAGSALIRNFINHDVVQSDTSRSSVPDIGAGSPAGDVRVADSLPSRRSRPASATAEPDLPANVLHGAAFADVTAALARPVALSRSLATRIQDDVNSAVVGVPPRAVVRIPYPKIAPVVPAPIANEALSAQTNPATTLATAVMTLTGLSSSVNGAPVAPFAPVRQLPVLALLGWVRRQIDYSYFNHTPTTAYKPIENSQTFGGVVTGNLHGFDADGDKLTYTVTGDPAQGAVTVNADGSFVYTPSDSLAFSGGTDTFTVKVDDQPGNPWHVHGLAGLFAPDHGNSTTTTINVTVKPTSPLGTADELSMEQLAAQIVNSPQVIAAKAQVKATWLAYGQAFYSQSGGPDAENLDQLDAAVDEFAMSAAYQIVNNNPEDPQVLMILDAPHDWYGTETPGARYAYDNPDTIYRTVPVSADSSYVITGKYLGGKPVDGNIGVYGDLAASQPLGNLPQDQIVVAPDGTFTITVDSLPTAPGQTNHIQLPPNAKQLFIRYTMSDWDTQSAPALTVVRTSGPADGPAPTFDELAAQTAAQMITNGTGAGIIRTAMSLTTVNLQTGQPKPPNQLTPVFNFPGTLVTQKQSLGYFNLADDQALVITIDPGSSKYFIVPVTNDWDVTPNYRDDQTSLNNAQAIANPDGTYTLVVSPTDPGVANWVSTGGLNQGTLFIRFQSITDPNDQPTISAQVVTLNQLNTTLPASTQYLTPEQRQAQLAARAAAYDIRYAPYAQT
jgi:Bacterial Ig domain